MKTDNVRQLKNFEHIGPRTIERAATALRNLIMMHRATIDQAYGLNDKTLTVSLTVKLAQTPKGTGIKTKISFVRKKESAEHFDVVNERQGQLFDSEDKSG